MPEFCRSERDGRTFIVTIDRPEVMNALDPPANAELAAIFDEFAADPALWVAILTGAGDRAFSAGNDLKHTAQGGGGSIPASGFAGLTSRFDSAKPVIAAVNGVAVGGGFEIALACDLIIASDKATFGLPEPKRGLAALAGGLHRLPRQIGLKPAMGLILTGRHIDAEAALRLGIVNDVVPHDDLMDRARAWADEILACAPLSVRASKQVVMDGLRHASLEEAMNDRYDSVGEMFRSADFREGPLAFAEKRAPVWKGE